MIEPPLDLPEVNMPYGRMAQDAARAAGYRPPAALARSPRRRDGCREPLALRGPGARRRRRDAGLRGGP